MGFADAGRSGVENGVGPGDPDRHRVDQNVAVVALVKADRASHRRYAERIAVIADPGHDAGDQAPGFGMLGRAEAQQIEAGDRPRAHCEYVAQDAADPGRRALVRFDERRVVVALHLEDTGLAVADIDHAGVLAGALDHPRRPSGQLAQVRSRRFVRAVLVPHRRHDSEFGKRRRAPDQRDEALIFRRFQPVLDGQSFIDPGFVFMHAGAALLDCHPVKIGNNCPLSRWQCVLGYSYRKGRGISATVAKKLPHEGSHR